MNIRTDEWTEEWVREREHQEAPGDGEELPGSLTQHSHSLHVATGRAKQMFRISLTMILVVPWKFPKILLVPRWKNPSLQ